MSDTPASEPPEANGQGDGEPTGETRAPESLRRELLAGVLIVVALAAAVAYKPIARLLASRPSEQQCAALLERYLEHAARAAHPDVDDMEIKRAKDDVRSHQDKLADVASCRLQLTAEQVRCGLESHNIDGLERCMQ